MFASPTGTIRRQGKPAIRRPDMGGSMGKVYSGRARRVVARIAVVSLLVAGASSFFAASAGAVSDPCQSVFEGVTPDPIQKTASVTQAHPGDVVTYTFSWHSTGADSADLTDCFQVGDGSNSALNDLVTPNNEVLNHDQSGDALGTLETVQLQIAIPNDASLIGHTVNDRAKITHGSQESRSNTVGVAVVAPECTENCNPQPSPTPSPTVSGTQAPTPKPSTSVKGVTLGKTGSSTGGVLWFGILFILLGAALSRVKAVRSLVPAVSTRVRRARHTKR